MDAKEETHSSGSGSTKTYDKLVYCQSGETVATGGSIYQLV